MNNLSKEKKQQLLLIAMMTVILAAGVWYGVITAQQKNLAAAKAATQKAQAKVDSAQKMLKRAEVIQQELQASEAELREREATMASGDLYQWFLSKMIPLAGPPLDNFNANPPVLADAALIPRFPYRAAIYNVKISGYYHDFGRFLASIENEFPYARIQNLDITAAPPTAGTEKLNFSFDFVTLYHTNRAITTR